MSQSGTIHMKAIEQYFPVVLFVMLYKVVLTFEPLDHIQSSTIQMTAIWQYYALFLLGSNFNLLVRMKS